MKLFRIALGLPEQSSSPLLKLLQSIELSVAFANVIEEPAPHVIKTDGFSLEHEEDCEESDSKSCAHDASNWTVYVDGEREFCGVSGAIGIPTVLSMQELTKFESVA